MHRQIAHFPNGEFVIHRIYLDGSRCKFSAWYDAKGTLTDSERIDARGRSYAPTDDQIRALSRIGDNIMRARAITETV